MPINVIKILLEKASINRVFIIIPPILSLKYTKNIVYDRICFLIIKYSKITPEVWVA